MESSSSTSSGCSSGWIPLSDPLWRLTGDGFFGGRPPKATRGGAWLALALARAAMTTAAASFRPRSCSSRCNLDVAGRFVRCVEGAGLGRLGAAPRTAAVVLTGSLPLAAFVAAALAGTSSTWGGDVDGSAFSVSEGSHSSSTGIFVTTRGGTARAGTSRSSPGIGDSRASVPVVRVNVSLGPRLDGAVTP